MGYFYLEQSQKLHGVKQGVTGHLCVSRYGETQTLGAHVCSYETSSAIGETVQTPVRPWSPILVEKRSY